VLGCLDVGAHLEQARHFLGDKLVVAFFGTARLQSLDAFKKAHGRYLTIKF